MSHSLNEIEATGRRAARGAGLSWGLAEEAGGATRWLCAQGLDGCAALARVLSQTAAPCAADLSPASLSGPWAASSGRLSPLVAGAALSDCAGMIGDAGISMRHLLSPVVILPFAAAVARHRQQVVTVAWDGLSAATDGPILSLEGDTAPLAAASAGEVKVRIGGTLGQPLAQAGRGTPAPDDWATLNRFASRTFAPASEASRLLGAGAGLSDND